MTPLQLAALECCNHRPDGTCTGCSFRCGEGGAVETYVMPQAGQTCLVGRAQRCEHFERVVLPLAEQPAPRDEPGLTAARQQARSVYLARHGGRPRAAGRKCPDCGESIGRRERVCRRCAKERRRKATRQWRRQSGDGMADVTVNAKLNAASACPAMPAEALFRGCGQ